MGHVAREADRVPGRQPDDLVGDLDDDRALQHLQQLTGPWSVGVAGAAVAGRAGAADWGCGGVPAGSRTDSAESGVGAALAAARAEDRLNAVRAGRMPFQETGTDELLDPEGSFLERIRDASEFERHRDVFERRHGGDDVEDAVVRRTEHAREDGQQEEPKELAEGISNAVYDRLLTEPLQFFVHCYAAPCISSARPGSTVFEHQLRVGVDPNAPAERITSRVARTERRTPSAPAPRTRARTARLPLVQNFSVFNHFFVDFNLFSSIIYILYEGGVLSPPVVTLGHR